MDQHQYFSVRDGIQYDMHLHGSRFIIVEFAFAAFLEVVLLLFSINYAFRLVDWPWWYWPWLILCAGMIPNSITVWLIARQIEYKEGPRPNQPPESRARHLAVTPPGDRSSRASHIGMAAAATASITLAPSVISKLLISNIDLFK